jgi:hypothetical protein
MICLASAGVDGVALPGLGAAPGQKLLGEASAGRPLDPGPGAQVGRRAPEPSWELHVVAEMEAASERLHTFLLGGQT